MTCASTVRLRAGDNPDLSVVDVVGQVSVEVFSLIKQFINSVLIFLTVTWKL
jgi:hypothetical protein